MNSFNRKMGRYCVDCIKRRQHYSVDKVHDAVLGECLTLFTNDRSYFTRGGIYEPLGVVNNQKDLNDIKNQYFSPSVDNDGKRSSTIVFPRDALHVRGNVKIRNLEIVDRLSGSVMGELFNGKIAEINRFIRNWKPPFMRGRVFAPYMKPVPRMSSLAHRDAIQIIPRNLNEHIDRYCGSSIGYIDIRNVNITSNGALQGIFSSDGIIEEVIINQCKIKVRSAHTVTLAGVLSGNINGIVNGRGENIGVSLLPLRLGGGRCNINVLDFSGNSQESYYQVYGSHINDLRSVPRRGMNVTDFDLDYFHDMYPLFKKISKRDRFYAIRETVDFMIMEGRARLVK